MKRAGLALLVAMLAAVLLIALPTGGAVAGKHHNHHHSRKHHKKKHHHKKKGKTYKSTVNDDYFSPTSPKPIKKGDSMKWKWSSANGDQHNVTLSQGPKGVSKKSFTSGDATTNFHFKKTFKKPGTYKFICTIHPTTMQETIKVKR